MRSKRLGAMQRLYLQCTFDKLKAAGVKADELSSYLADNGIKQAMTSDWPEIVDKFLAQRNQ